MSPPADPVRPIERAEEAGRVELGPGLWLAESALRFQYARSSGPGGQNVNKVNTKSELWAPVAALVAAGLSPAATDRLRRLAGRRLTDAGEIHIASDTHRSQQANREAAIDRLRVLVSSAMHEPKARRKVRPSRAARQRRLEGKRHRSEIKGNRRAGRDDG